MVYLDDILHEEVNEKPEPLGIWKKRAIICMALLNTGILSIIIKNYNAPALFFRCACCIRWFSILAQQADQQR